MGKLCFLVAACLSKLSGKSEMNFAIRWKTFKLKQQNRLSQGRKAEVEIKRIHLIESPSCDHVRNCTMIILFRALKFLG